MRFSTPASFSLDRLLLALVEQDEAILAVQGQMLIRLSRDELMVVVERLIADYTLFVVSNAVAEREWILGTRANLLALDERRGES